jgi:DNA-binding Lrp family transcriptional regulator
VHEFWFELMKWLTSLGVPTWIPAILTLIFILLFVVFKWISASTDNKLLLQEISSLKFSLSSKDDFREAYSKSRDSISDLGYCVEHSKDLSEIINAVVKLGQLQGRPEAFDCLNFCLRNRTESREFVGLRWHIFKSLQQVASNQAINLLIKEGLSDEEPVIRSHVINLLGQFFGQNKNLRKLVVENKQSFIKLEDKMLSRLNDSNEYQCVKTQAYWALRQIKSEKVKSPPKGSGKIVAYILIKGPKGLPDRSHVKQLQEIHDPTYGGIIEGGQILGDWDFIVKVLAEDIESLHSIVMRQFHGLGWVESTRTLVVINEPRLYYWRRLPSTQKSGRDFSSAYVFIRTPALTTGGLIASLMDIDEVTEAGGLYGGRDVIAKIEAIDQEHRDRAIVEKVGKIPFVEFTQTYVITVSLESWDYTDTGRFNFPYGKEWRIPRRT